MAFLYVHNCVVSRPFSSTIINIECWTCKKTAARLCISRAVRIYFFNGKLIAQNLPGSFSAISRNPRTSFQDYI